jgi:riboflavin kinase / FMN adenylyltransferase
VLIWRSLSDVPADVHRSVVAIGVFDGVHIGHRAVLQRVVEEARARDALAVVVTFDPHPAKVVGRPVPRTLTNLHRRAQLFADIGIDRMFVLQFSREISEWSPEEFVQRLLVDTLHATHVIVGENFRFGHKQAGDVKVLADIGAHAGFTVDPVRLLAGDSEPVSSTWIRTRIDEGEVAAAARGLGRLYAVDGPVVRGDGRGRGLGYPTANVEVGEDFAVPADGVYAGWLVRSDRTRLPAAISVGTNPTFDGTERRVEAYALDVDIDMYGEHVSVEFAHWLRGMVRFESVDDLLVQMAQDVTDSRRILQPDGKDSRGSMSEMGGA